MKLVLKTALFHITCILFFSFIYFSYKEDFIPVDKTEKYNNFIRSNLSCIKDISNTTYFYYKSIYNDSTNFSNTYSSNNTLFFYIINA